FEGAREELNGEAILDRLPRWVYDRRMGSGHKNWPGGRLKELREEAGLTQRQLAEAAGLHPQAIVKLERGEREPAWSTLVSLANGLCRDVGTLVSELTEGQIQPLTPRPRGRPRQNRTT